MKKQQILFSSIRVCLVVSILFLQCFQFQYSAIPSIGLFFAIKPIRIMINIVAVSVFVLLVSLFIRRWRTVFAVSGTLFLIWNVINYYVVLYHGSPLYLSEFHNLKTAAAVIDRYRFSVSNAVIGLLLVYLMEMICVFLLTQIERKPEKTKTRYDCRIVSFLAGILIVSYAIHSSVFFSWNNTTGWSWMAEVERNGYVCSHSVRIMV